MYALNPDIGSYVDNIVWFKFPDFPGFPGKLTAGIPVSREKAWREIEKPYIEGNGQPPLKMKILKICFFHVRKGPNIDSEPNFHDPMTSNVGDYPGQPKSKF